MEYDYNYDFEYTRNHVPAFGSWDLNNNIPFTQCFESVGLHRYSYSGNRDMYVTGDLYDNNVVTPAMIVVPRRMGKARATLGKKDAWVVYDYAYDHDYICDAKEPPIEQPRNHVKQKAVDEDLYRISPELLHVKPKRGVSESSQIFTMLELDSFENVFQELMVEKKWWLFSSCMQPTCVM